MQASVGSVRQPCKNKDSPGSTLPLGAAAAEGAFSMDPGAWGKESSFGEPWRGVVTFSSVVCQSCILSARSPSTHAACSQEEHDITSVIVMIRKERESPSTRTFGHCILQFARHFLVATSLQQRRRASRSFNRYIGIPSQV